MVRNKPSVQTQMRQNSHIYFCQMCWFVSCLALICFPLSHVFEHKAMKLNEIIIMFKCFCIRSIGYIVATTPCAHTHTHICRNYAKRNEFVFVQFSKWNIKLSPIDDRQNPSQQKQETDDDNDGGTRLQPTINFNRNEKKRISYGNWIIHKTVHILSNKWFFEKLPPLPVHKFIWIWISCWAFAKF